jgi:hypothetical protein
MTAWAIHLPHRGDRSAPLASVSEAARFLPQDEDRAITRQLVMDWRLGGLKTVGDALDLVAALEPAERRRVLNHARKAIGLQSVEEVEAAQPKPLRVRTTGAGGGFPTCAADGCNAAPVRASTGVFYHPGVRRWWCPDHEHLAEPADLEAPGSGIKLSPVGVPIPDEAAADERDRVREASRRAQRQAEGETRAVEAAEARASKQASDAAFRQTLPEHLRRIT